jgi:hypothetical protein
MRFVGWVISLVAVAGIAASSALAQTSGTGASGGALSVSEGTLTDLDARARSSTPPDGITLSLVPTLTLVRAVFEGETRQTSQAMTSILSGWFVVHQIDPAQLTFPEEWLFREGSSRFWVPMESGAAAALRPQLVGGEEVALTVAYFGASRSDGDIVSIFPAFQAELEARGGEASEDDAGWESFKPGTIREIVELEGQNLSTDFTLSGWTFPTRATLRFEGETRPISPPIAQLIAYWLGMLGEDAGRLQFDEEWLFREGQTNYWLPVQPVTADSMRPVVKKGDIVTVYFRYAGVYKAGGRENWVFPVMKTVSYE